MDPVLLPVCEESMLDDATTLEKLSSQPPSRLRNEMNSRQRLGLQKTPLRTPQMTNTVLTPTGFYYPSEAELQELVGKKLETRQNSILTPNSPRSKV